VCRSDLSAVSTQRSIQILYLFFCFSLQFAFKCFLITLFILLVVSSIFIRLLFYTFFFCSPFGSCFCFNFIFIYRILIWCSSCFPGFYASTFPDYFYCFVHICVSFFVCLFVSSFVCLFVCLFLSFFLSLSLFRSCGLGNCEQSWSPATSETKVTATCDLLAVSLIIHSKSSK
jgi:hypothetical protein